MSSSSRSGLLSVKGAKYDNNRRNGDGDKDKILDKLQQASKTVDYSATQQYQSTQQQLVQPSMNKTIQPTVGSLNSGIPTKQQPTMNAMTDVSSAKESDKYWKNPGSGTGTGSDDLVIIHVCDENQQISKDFCCKRDILVHHMKYFEKFLSENESGYDDIDISVHCDVEIFEWLMAYIHDPHTPPVIDKAIIVSILISSEFLQMESLVDLCVQHVSSSLSEIIKLPIDLSCISERLINRIAFITHPKTLSETRDKKDKILTKLYKRRVELDFSRKGSSTPKGPSGPVPTRTIAASLTCCRHCGLVYLDNYVGFLHCRSSPPSINFRGQLASRHSSIPGWSLTSYLKALHSGGMGWDAIYWHVWAACVVFRAESVMVSALEVDRYTIETDGLLIRGSVTKEPETSNSVDEGTQRDGSSSPVNNSGKPPLTPKAASSPPLVFSLGTEDDFCPNGSAHEAATTYKLLVSMDGSSSYSSSPGITSSLNPLRPPEVLTPEVFCLVCSQMKYIAGLAHRQLIQSTMRAIVASVKTSERSQQPFDFGALLWGVSEGSEREERRRGRSPTGRARSMEPRRMAASNLSKRASVASPSVAPAGSGSGADTGDTSRDGSDNEGRSAERLRSRSSSMGKRAGHSASQQRLLGKGARKDSSTGDSGSSKLDTINGSGSGSVDVAVLEDPAVRKQISILLSVPPEVRHLMVTTRGAVFGVWNSTHPLQTISPAYEDALAAIGDAPGLSDQRRLEWELDLMREHDERRMERYERLLASRRNPAVDSALQLHKLKSPTAQQQTHTAKGSRPPAVATFGSGTGGNGYFASRAGSSSSDYYKDRGRQVYR